MAGISGRGGAKDRIIHEIGRAIKQAQVEWCGVGCVRACTGRWLVLSLDAALLHGLRCLGQGYWPVLATLLDRPTLDTITALPYATIPLTRGRSWLCLCLNEGQLENYLHVLTSHPSLLATHYEAHGLLRDPHRSHVLLMLAAGLEHLKFAIPIDVPGWIQAEGSVGSSSGTSINSVTTNISLTSADSSLPSPSLQDATDFELDTSCTEAIEENWVTRRKKQGRSSSRASSGDTTPVVCSPVTGDDRPTTGHNYHHHNQNHYNHHYYNKSPHHSTTTTVVVDDSIFPSLVAMAMEQEKGVEEEEKASSAVVLSSSVAGNRKGKQLCDNSCCKNDDKDDSQVAWNRGRGRGGEGGGGSDNNSIHSCSSNGVRGVLCNGVNFGASKECCGKSVCPMSAFSSDVERRQGEAQEKTVPASHMCACSDGVGGCGDVKTGTGTKQSQWCQGDGDGEGGGEGTVSVVCQGRGLGVSVEPKVILRQHSSSSTKNSEKRVSFTDVSEADPNNKAMHKRLSLCGGTGKGLEIRDLGDLKELMTTLKSQGLLPGTLSLDQLFSSFEQSSPALSERAPPEGQEDPPLHQSITSLFPINNNNNNNDSNNNNNNNNTATTSTTTTTTTTTTTAMDCHLPTTATTNTEGTPGTTTREAGLDEAGVSAGQEGKDRGTGLNAMTAPQKDREGGDTTRVGCLAHHSDIIDGVRWEELTKIGQEIMNDGSLNSGSPGEALISRIYQGGDREGGRGCEAEDRATGTKPKRRQDYLHQSDLQLLRPSISPLSAGSKTMISVGGKTALAPRRTSFQSSTSHHHHHHHHHHVSLAERRRLYRRLYREERRVPSLFIPAKVDPLAFKDEEDRLALEVAQGQSNLTQTGTQMDPAALEKLSAHLFAVQDERFYKVFSAREGHSSGRSVGVQVVLSTHALYIVSPRPPGARPRHTLKYSDIYATIVGGSDQWVCVLSSKAVQECESSSASQTFPGVQLEVGDPDITHSLMGSLELAIRRHFQAGHVGMRGLASPHTARDLNTSRKNYLLEFTRECVDNFSNSLLEESLLSVWDAQKPADVSQATGGSSEASPAVTPGSVHSSQEEASEASQPSSSSSSPASSSSSSSSDISNMANENIDKDVSQSSSEVSHASEEHQGQASSEDSQASSDNSRLSSDVVLGSSDSSRHVSDLSNNGSLSDDTPTSSDLVQSLSSLSDASLNASQTDAEGESESGESSQHSAATIRDEEEEGEGEAGKAAEGPKHPLHLSLQKTCKFYSFAGGYTRWNGALLDQSLPGVVVRPSWELPGLSAWLKAKLRQQEGPEVVGYWLVDWEDGSSLGTGDSVYGPLGPTKEGALMFKPPGLLMPWRPAYFILKAGVLYQFSDVRERLPHMIVEVVQCVGCVRVSSTHRPHAFQLLRKKDAPLMMAASDEHQASLWLQAFLTIINSGVRDISERSQVSCRVVVLRSGVLLAQQSDLLLGAPPPPPSLPPPPLLPLLPPPSHQSTLTLPLQPDAHTHTASTTTANNKTKDTAPGNTTQQQQQSTLDPSLPTSQSSQPQPQTQMQTITERKDVDKTKTLPLFPNIKDRKPLNSVTALNHISGTSSVPGSPVRRVVRGDKAVSSAVKSLHLRQNSLSRLGDIQGASEEKEKEVSMDYNKPSLPLKTSLPLPPPSPQRKASSAQQKSLGEAIRKGNAARHPGSLKFSGEVKVLTISALEHLSSVSLYAECPTSCLLEFECSEAGEISGDWALYFRSGGQLQQFVSALKETWQTHTQNEFPLRRVDDAGVQQFLLEGSQISSDGWSLLHL